MNTNPAILAPFDLYRVGDDVAEINGTSIESGEDRVDVHDWIVEGFQQTTVCPYCLTALDIVQELSGDPEDVQDAEEVTLWDCSECSYWQMFIHTFSDYPPAFVQFSAYLSKLQEFDVKSADPIIEELTLALRRNPSIWETVHPTALEKLVAAVFRINHGACEVFHVGKPNDGGSDVVFIDSENKKWLIQVKRHSSNSAEGVSTIRNLLGAMILQGSLNGVVVSSADHFSVQAHRAVSSVRQRGIMIQLLDRGKLDRMIQPLLPKHRWLPLMDRIDTNLAAEFQRRLSKTNGSLGSIR